MPTDGDILAEGSWLYDGAVPAKIRVRFQSVRYGSHDYEDPPEIMEDFEIPTYVLEFEVAGSNGEHWSGSGQFDTLTEAMTRAEAIAGVSVRWVA